RAISVAVVRSRREAGMSEAPAHVLVTGAAGAIGSALARAMRRAWPATQLALLDQETEAMVPLATELGRATTHACDLRRLEEIPDTVAEIARAQPLDGLVNCAGVMRVQHVASWSWEAASSLLAIDLLAPLRLQDLVVRGLVERDQRG